MPEPMSVTMTPLLLLLDNGGTGLGVFEAFAGPYDGSQVLSFMYGFEIVGSIAMSREMRTALAAMIVSDLRGGKKAAAAIRAMPDFPAEGEPQ